MTVSPMPPAPVAGGSFATMLPDYNQMAADAAGQSGYGNKKIVNGTGIDKASLLAQFRRSRGSSDQTEYRNTVELLKRLGLVSGKNPSRASVEKGYNNLLTDFYLAPEKDFGTYATARLGTAAEQGVGTRVTTSRQQSTPSEAAQIITITTRDAAGNATTTTVGGVATKEDREALALDFIGKALGKQEGIVNAGPTLNAGLTAIRKFANDYGVVIPDADVRGYAMQYLRDGKLDFITEKLKNISKARYPGLAQYIDQGVSPREIASQYMVRKAQLLEIPIESINVFDNDVTRAIGGQVLETIGDFDNRMRQSPLWQFTKNAKEKGANFINNILSRFGMV